MLLMARGRPLPAWASLPARLKNHSSTKQNPGNAGNGQAIGGLGYQSSPWLPLVNPGAPMQSVKFKAALYSCVHVQELPRGFNSSEQMLFETETCFATWKNNIKKGTQTSQTSQSLIRHIMAHALGGPSLKHIVNGVVITWLDRTSTKCQSHVKAPSSTPLTNHPYPYPYGHSHHQRFFAGQVSLATSRIVWCWDLVRNCATMGTWSDGCCLGTGIENPLRWPRPLPPQKKRWASWRAYLTFINRQQPLYT